MHFVILLLLWVGLAQAAILRVPEDHPGIQAAFDASAEGDTVLVARGTWTGLLESPVHSILFCSHYLFSQDSTDIVETVLDGQYAGTILNVNTLEPGMLTVTGFTFWRGQGQQTGGAGYCDRAGAVNMQADVSATLTDLVFADCRAPRMASILFKGVECSGWSVHGDLIMKNIHCRGCVVDTPQVNGHDAILISQEYGRVIVDGFRFDGGGLGMFIMRNQSLSLDTLALSNVHVFNCNNARLTWTGRSRTRYAGQVSNIKLDGCQLILVYVQVGEDTTLGMAHNLEVFNMSTEDAMIIHTGGPKLEVDGLHIHHTRNPTSSTTVTVDCAFDKGNVMRNLNMHDNVKGDSVLVGQTSTNMLVLVKCSLVNAHIHDNRLIIAGNPNIGEELNVGNVAYRGAFLYMEDGYMQVENILCENNRVEDLDDYQRPGTTAPRENVGREIYIEGADSLFIKNVIVRNSRQPNWCPEWVGENLSVGMPGNVFLAYGWGHAENILIEDCDDGGIQFFGLDATNIVVRNVGRMGAWFLGPSAHVRNLQIENVDVADDDLQPQDEAEFAQYALGLYGGHFVLENVSITGCDGLRYPIKLWFDTEAQFRNSLFWDNQSGPLAYTGSGGTASWEYCLAQETLPGTGNLVADPRFDSQLGAPFLAPDSPCIDAGNSDPAYNDLEDPANPGFPLWPSLGNLRCDMGYTGGPHASLLDTSWSAVPAWEPRTQPQVFTLGNPWPNPFNPVTHVSYTLTRPMTVHLTVHNLLGQEVAVLVNAIRPAGTQQASFDGSRVASGIYLVTLQAAGRAETRVVTLAQ